MAVHQVNKELQWKLGSVVLSLKCVRLMKSLFCGSILVCFGSVFLSSTPRSSTIIHVFQVGQISRDRLYRVRLVGNWYESLAYPGDQREQPIWRGITVTLWKLWKQTQATSYDVSTSIFWERETWDAVIPTESLDSQFHPTSQVHWWGSGAHDSNSSVFRSHSWRYTCKTWRWLWQVPTKA